MYDTGNKDISFSKSNSEVFCDNLKEMFSKQEVHLLQGKE